MSAPLRRTTLPQWRGQPGRMEVWYVTATEPDGSGWWFHHEMVAPTDGTAGGPNDPAARFGHGWVAYFPVDGTPRVERFGPFDESPDAALTATALASTAGSRSPASVCTLFDSGRQRHSVDGDVITMRGDAGSLGWDLRADGAAPTLYTFPRWAWDGQRLPGAQIVDRPGLALAGTVTVDGTERDVTMTGAQAHIYSHGNAPRWAWLHAELPDGQLLEVVAATPHLPVPVVSVPPLPIARIRLGGVDRPGEPVAASLFGGRSVDLPRWSVAVPLGPHRRVRAEVSMPAQRCVQIEYPNPDGTTVFCTNTERADVDVVVEERPNLWSAWRTEEIWSLDGTGHAEVGRSVPWDAVAFAPWPPS